MRTPHFLCSIGVHIRGVPLYTIVFLHTFSVPYSSISSQGNCCHRHTQSSVNTGVSHDLVWCNVMLPVVRVMKATGEAGVPIPDLLSLCEDERYVVYSPTVVNIRTLLRRIIKASKNRKIYEQIHHSFFYHCSEHTRTVCVVFVALFSLYTVW